MINIRVFRIIYVLPIARGACAVVVQWRTEEQGIKPRGTYVYKAINWSTVR